MKKITHTSLVIISLLSLFVQPLQAAQVLSTTSGADTIDTAPISDYQPISEKGVDKFEEYLLMLQKKCVEAATVEKGITLVVGTTGSGKSTIICDLLGVPLVGVNNNEEDNDSSDEDDSSDEGKEFYTGIDVDKNYNAAFPLPTIGHDLSQSQTFFPALFANPKAKDGLHYCDMPGFHDKRGEEEKVIASIAPALMLHSAKKVKAILAIISYDNITSSKGEKFMEVITDVMAYFKHAPWQVIKKATFIGITKCACVPNKNVKKVIKDLIRGVDNKLADKRQEYDKALEGLHAHNSNKITLDNNKKNEYEKAVSDYEILKTQARFFEIFSEIDAKTKKIKCDNSKLLFSRPLHKQKAKYRVKIIETLKSSPGLEKAHLSACDYSNPTLSHQLTAVVGRMCRFFSTRENLKEQNRNLQASIANSKETPRLIQALQNKIITTSAEIEKEKTNISFVSIYSPPAYQRMFYFGERCRNWIFGTCGAVVGGGVGIAVGATVGAAAASAASVAVAVTGATSAAGAVVTGAAAVVTGATSIAGAVATTGAVAGGVDGAIDKKKKAYKEACKGVINLGKLLGGHLNNIRKNTRPNKKFDYTANEPVYKMSVTYGPGTFNSTSPDGWNINRESANGLDTFNYQPNNIQRNYPVFYTFEYMGYFHTDGFCELKLFSKYNELKTTKNRIEILGKSVDTMKETIEALTKNKESKEKDIISNKEKIDQLDQCIRNTYEKREKNQDIAYCLSKCEMLEFFQKKPLFNANAAVQMNDEKDDEKEEKKEDEKTEIDHPLIKHMQDCIKQWRQWLKENSDKK